jgi:hypothetical protein
MSRVVATVTARKVQLRADGRCEYCQLADTSSFFGFQIDHIVALNHLGSSSMDNLAWVCTQCNKFKGPNLASVDPISGRRHYLFNPRKDKWRFHFEMRSGLIVALTAKGRATLSLLKMNDPAIVAIREGSFLTNPLPDAL